MSSLAVKLLRHRAGPAVATLLALAVGVLILVAMGTLVESGVRFHPQPRLYRAADQVVAHREVTYTSKDIGGDPETTTAPLTDGGMVDAGLVKQIRQVPGVATVAGDDRILIGPAVGHGSSLYAFTGLPGSGPSADDQIVADVRLGTPAGGHLNLLGQSYQVIRTVDTGSAQVFFTDAQAAKLSAHPGRYDAIGVIDAPGADKAAVTSAVRGITAAAGVKTYAGKDRGQAEQSADLEARDFLIAAGSSFGGYVIMLIVFVVAGTIGLSVRHRRRDLALLRAIAATPRQLRKMLMAETALLSLVAAAIGVPAGLLAARQVHGSLVHRGFIPADFPIVTGWIACAAAVVTAVLVAVLAALLAGRRVTKIKPVEALGEIAVEPKHPGKVRLVFGLVTLIGAAGAGAYTAVFTGAAAALAGAVGMLYLFIVAVSLLAPWINAFAARLLAPALSRVWRASGYLAAKNLRANAQGMSAVLTALVLSVGFGGSVWFLQNNMERQTLAQNREGTLANQVVLGGDAAAIRKIPGVRAATGVRNTSVVVKGLDGVEPAAGQVVDTAGLSSTMDLGVTQGSLAALGAGTVAVSTVQASTSGWHVGDQASIWLGDGIPVTLKVIAIYQRGLGFGDVTLSSATVAGHMPQTTDDEVLVSAAPGTSLTGWNVVDAAAHTQQISNDLDIGAWLNKLLIGVMVGYAALAAATTMVMAALARRRELALLQLVGVTRRQIRRMVNAEQAGLLGTAVLLGATIAALTLGSIVFALTGNPIPYVPPLGWVAVLGGAALLALATTILPVRRLLRIPPIQNIGLKE